MPTKRKGASKHRQSRRSRRHSRRSVRGAGKKASRQSNGSTIHKTIAKTHPKKVVESTSENGVPFEFIGSPAEVEKLKEKYKNRRTNKPHFETYIGKIAPNGHYMPGFVLWTQGDVENSTSPGWYEVTEFNEFNEPMGEARGIIHNVNGTWTYMRNAIGEIATYPIGIPSPAHATHPRPEPLMNGV